MTGQALAVLPTEVKIGDGNEGFFEFTDEALVRADPWALREFERALLLEARRRQVVVLVQRDLLRLVWRVSWVPAPTPSEVGVWKQA